MANPFSIIQSAIVEREPEVRRPKNWRADLRSKVGHKLHDILFDLAQGKAWVAELADGRTSAPVLPSSDVRLRAAMYLHEALYGKAVPQTEIQRAELEAREMEAIHALSDDELAVEAMRIIQGRKVPRLEETTTEYAEIVPDLTIQMTDFNLGVTIFAATPAEDDE